MADVVKAKYWWGVLYPENMIDDWQNKIGDIIQLPFAYCVHNKDICSELEQRKEHLHLIVVWNNNTTYKSAFNLFNKLSKDGFRCLNKIEPVVSIRHAYDYLIHNTDSCRKQKKYRYDEKERISGNLFDIGAYEQVSMLEKTLVCKEISIIIKEHKFINFLDVFDYVISHFEEPVYFEVLKTYSGFFDRLCKGNFLKLTKEAKIELGY